ncbi:unnamed protein product [Albugo candida]|uniref:Uncharacterized protein n=1 Tax=Albugo candida TaxID=65357 RepID=A0A024G6B8_9STRA|nr:unnamed protein product [Albugo candida]|eukprot:CCI42109.1 unnamed protein product [Albugo candida]
MDSACQKCQIKDASLQSLYDINHKSCCNKNGIPYVSLHTLLTYILKFAFTDPIVLDGTGIITTTWIQRYYEYLPLQSERIFLRFVWSHYFELNITERRSRISSKREVIQQRLLFYNGSHDSIQQDYKHKATNACCYFQIWVSKLFSDQSSFLLHIAA